MSDSEKPLTARFLALGDSYTIGEGVPVQERWPMQLVALLRATGASLIHDPQIVAETGWTTDELMQAIAQSQIVGKFDLVTLLIGVNNQYRGRPLEEYRQQFSVLLATAINFAAGVPARVVVLSIPDWGVTPFAEGRDRLTIAREIDAFNEANRDATTRSGAHYVDVTGVSRLAGSDPAMVTNDGLHPSGPMYTQWARLALPTAQAALRTG